MEPVSQLLRRSTILAATSYTFPADDAIGFPDVLPEARKIGLGRRSLTGFMTSGQKVEGLGPFESSLERDYFVLLEFDRRVLAWHPQPFRLDVPAGSGKRARRYTPDVAVEYAKIPDGQDLDRVELCEIKYRDELKNKWHDLKPLLKVGVRHARSQGWRFRICTEVEIRTPRLWNAKFLLPYGRQGASGEDIARLALNLEAFGPGTPSTLLGRCQADPTERGRLLTVLWHMAAIGLIEFDVDNKLNMNSQIRLSENARF